MTKSIDDAEEEKSAVSVKKLTKTQENKKELRKPRVRKGAPLNSKKTGYAKNSVGRTPKPVQKLSKPEEIESVLNLPNIKPSFSIKDASNDEVFVSEENSYEIITTEAPPFPQLKFNTAKQFPIENNSSSDDQSYHSDDKELFNIREVDEKMEHTNKDLKFKLSEIERNEREYSRLIEQRRNEIINKIGIGCFQELYAYFKEKYSVRVI